MALDSFDQILGAKWSLSLTKDDKLVKGKIIHQNKHFVTVDVGGKKSLQLPNSKYGKQITKFSSPNKSVLLQCELMSKPESSKSFKMYHLLHDSPATNPKEILKIIEKNKSFTNGLILNEVKGGYSVGIGGIVAFLPKSQILFPAFSSTSMLCGLKTLHILSIDEKNQNMVVSRLKANQAYLRLKKNMKK